MVDNDVTSGICAKLKELFPEIPVAKEVVKQGMTLPYFTVSFVNSSASRFLGEMFFYSGIYEIRYHPADIVAPKFECLGVKNVLDLGAEIIEFEVADLPVSAIALRPQGRIVSGVLVYVVTYNFKLHVPPAMGHLMEILEPVEFFEKEVQQ